MITAPYMHDGRMETIDAVFEHYTSGMLDSPYLDSTFKQGQAIGIPLTSSEKSTLKAFLNTLTDTDFVTRRMLSEF